MSNDPGPVKPSPHFALVDIQEQVAMPRKSAAAAAGEKKSIQSPEKGAGSMVYGIMA